MIYNYPLSRLSPSLLLISDCTYALAIKKHAASEYIHNAFDTSKRMCLKYLLAVYASYAALEIYRVAICMGSRKVSR